jgi:hypothetical protein
VISPWSNTLRMRSKWDKAFTGKTVGFSAKISQYLAAR